MSVLVPLQAPYAPIPTSSGNAPVRFKFWHETLIDLMLQHPDWTNKQLADAVGKNAVTIGYVTRSDMFKARFALRRQEHSERISYAIIAQTQGIAQKALKQLDEKLEDNSVQRKISARDLGEIAAEALDRIGLGPKPPDIVVQTNIQQNTHSVTVSQEALIRARQKLRGNEAVLIGASQSGAPVEIEQIVQEPVRDAILDELMTIGAEEQSPEGEMAEASASEPAAQVVPSPGRSEGEA